MLSRSIVLSSLFLMSLGANETGGEIVKIDPELSVIRGGDQLPVESFEHATDPYLEGYIQSLIDTNYYEFDVIVVVKDHHVTLYNLPNNDLISKSIVSYIQDLPGVKSVEVKKELTSEEVIARKKYTEAPRVSGVWFPQTTVLFQPLVADPREPVYSVNYRAGDRVMGRKAIAVSLGDDFPFFRWLNVNGSGADVQIGISAGVWAVFNFSHVLHRGGGDCELMNTDYLVGIPVSYACNKWSFRMRPYHISGHLGDEFIVDNPKFLKKRKNPSFEAIDWINSYQFSSGLRVYGGPGVVFHSDPSFRLKPLYVMWGTEIRLFGQKLYYHRLYGTPFFAAHMENWEQHNWELDMSFKMGYELSKLQGVGRKMRLYVAYHEGFSYEGQFFNKRTQYGELGFSWGF
ncbi:MAG: DUF1207 domain-containing protein [Rhabdochlamydiaceae bacterium]|nr:DUF1207 domain-containing protein [Rhabdochlamydiaceae bacterium]